MQALYHALPMDYVTVAKLQSKLEGEANQTIVRKLMNRMAREGYIEGKGIRKFGNYLILRLEMVQNVVFLLRFL